MGISGQGTYHQRFEKAIALSNSSNQPDTVVQLRSLAKKAAAVAQPLAACAKWIQENPNAEDGPKWNEVLSSCQEIFDAASSAVYATDEDDVDMISALEELSELVNLLRPTAK